MIGGIAENEEADILEAKQSAMPHNRRLVELSMCPKSDSSSFAGKIIGGVKAVLLVVYEVDARAVKVVVNNEFSVVVSCCGLMNSVA
jgi:hypothetical protein